MTQDITQPYFRVHAVKPAGADKRVQHRGPLTAAVGAGKKPVFPAQGYATQGVLRDVVIYFGPAITAVQVQRVPLLQQVGKRVNILCTSEELMLSCSAISR